LNFLILGREGKGREGVGVKGGRGREGEREGWMVGGREGKTDGWRRGGRDRQTD
jgi:hypothetical protein